MIEGSCLCGATRFRIDGTLSGVRLCHCENCRKFSGTSPAAWAMASASKLEVLSASVGTFNSGKGIRNFCSKCGSPVWFESLDHPEIVGIPLGVLDSDDVPPPEMHIWVSSKPGWCSISDGLPEYDTLPG